MPAYRGWTNAGLHEPAGLPVPVGEDSALVADPALDEKGYRIVRTEQAVFAAHPNAAHFRYPYLYGPYQPAPREWTIVRRILDRHLVPVRCVHSRPYPQVARLAAGVPDVG